MMESKINQTYFLLVCCTKLFKNTLKKQNLNNWPFKRTIDCKKDFKNIIVKFQPYLWSRCGQTEYCRCAMVKF